MASDEAWIRAETGGTKRAVIIDKSAVLGTIIRKATRPVLILGDEDFSGREYVPLAAMIKKISSRIPVIATSPTATLNNTVITPLKVIGIMDLVQYLCDPVWNGIDGEGKHDLILLAGFSYSLGSIVLSGLKTGARELRTVTLDPRYHPNASWSMPNQKIRSWEDLLRETAETIAAEPSGEKSHV